MSKVLNIDRATDISLKFLQAVLRFQKLDKSGIRDSDILPPDLQYVQGYVKARAFVRAMTKEGSIASYVERCNNEVRERLTKRNQS